MHSGVHTESDSLKRKMGAAQGNAGSICESTAPVCHRGVRTPEEGFKLQRNVLLNSIQS